MIGKSIILIFSCLLIARISGWDQISIVPIRVLLPFISTSTTDELIELLNRQNNTNQSIEVFNSWLDEHWTNPPASTPKPVNSTAPTPYYGRFVEKEYARNQTIGFLEYRGAFKKYVRFLFRSTQILNYFTQKEAEEMRDEIYKRDRYCYNDINCVESNFLYEVAQKFKGTKKNVMDDLSTLTNVVHRFPGVGDKLNWTYVRS